MKHSREYAIGILNDWYDSVGIDNEDRIKYSLTKEEKEELSGLEPDDIIFQELDYQREKTIQAIMNKKIYIDEIDVNGQKEKCFVMKMDAPIKSKEGEILIDKLTIKNRFLYKEYARACNGLKPENPMQFITAKIAARCGVARSVIDNLYDNEVELLSSVNGLFTRVQ